MELAGLRGQMVFCRGRSSKRAPILPRLGSGSTISFTYRLGATTNDDTGTLEMWIPLPKLPGPFFIHLSLTTDGASIASTDTNLFD
jgi:hypothetical protein